jgi:hypothetical protein
MLPYYLFVPPLVAGVAPPAARSTVAARAEAQLHKHGALFRQGRLWKVLLDEKEDPRDPACYVMLAKGWTGGREQLKHLRDLPHLKEVLVSGPEFREEWCAELAGLTRLEGVYFHGENFTDRALACLAGMRELRAVSLVDAPATDAGIRLGQRLVTDNLGRSRFSRLIPARRACPAGTFRAALCPDSRRPRSLPASACRTALARAVSRKRGTARAGADQGAAGQDFGRSQGSEAGGSRLSSGRVGSPTAGGRGTPMLCW